MFTSRSRRILGGVTLCLVMQRPRLFPSRSSAFLLASPPAGPEEESTCPPGDGPGSGAPRSCPELSYIVTSCLLQEGPRNVVWPQAQEGKRTGGGAHKAGRLDQWNSDRELSRENGDRQPALVLTGGS